VLELRKLGFAYQGQPALFDGISAIVPDGHILAIVGRNGAGKSTLFRIINGLLRPQSGDVLVDGISTSGKKIFEIAAYMGTVFQSPEQQLFAARVEDEVAFGPQQLGLSTEKILERATDALNRTSLLDQSAQHPLDLSAAERRFLAIASVLAMAPPVLLLDEAQRGLDRVWTERLEDVLGAERAAGKSIIMICHDMDFVERNADTVLALGGLNPCQIPVSEFFSDKKLLTEVSVEPPVIYRLREFMT